MGRGPSICDETRRAIQEAAICGVSYKAIAIDLGVKWDVAAYWGRKVCGHRKPGPPGFGHKHANH